MKKITGAITALVTPFKQSGEIDVASLEKLVDWQIESGINGLVPCGSTGEAATQTIGDYKLVVETVIKKTAGRVPVIAGATSNDTSKAVELSIIAKNAGADVLLHATPYYNKPTLAGLVAHYKEIAKVVDLPIIIYNVPGRTGLNLTSSMTLEIAKQVDQIVGIKEASGNIIQIMEVIKGASTDFSTLSGDDAMTLPVMAAGGMGIISVASNEIPSEMTDLVSSALSGNFEKARKVHFKWVDLMNVNFIESNPIPVKTAMSMMG
ncbi:MAG TPA: 4-hydroxy-tetrahydrodipicolinate synthase, partial [Candidatus Saccharimonadales bacterium]|nr:4-hydroxy-tetrahydrodipicolinate synthase [Candidatus Saccharimonadales bacterium]